MLWSSVVPFVASESAMSFLFYPCMDPDFVDGDVVWEPIYVLYYGCY